MYFREIVETSLLAKCYYKSWPDQVLLDVDLIYYPFEILPPELEIIGFLVLINILDTLIC